MTSTYETNPDEWMLAQFEPGTIGWGIDCGVNDGMFQSNSIRLEQMGWNVLCVEADYRLVDSIKRYRKIWALCAVAESGGDWATFHAASSSTPSGQSLKSPKCADNCHLRVPQMTIDQLLHIFGFPQCDFMTLDIEGGELDALQGANLDKWRPRVIVAEHYADWPDCQPYLEANGYKYMRTYHGLDKCFIRDE